MAASGAQVLFLPLSSLLVTPHTTRPPFPGIPSKAPGQDLVWPPGHVSIRNTSYDLRAGKVLNWLGLWDHAPPGGMAGSLGACWPALEVEPVRAGGASGQGPRASQGVPGFGDPDTLAGTCLR